MWLFFFTTKTLFGSFRSTKKCSLYKIRNTLNFSIHKIVFYCWSKKAKKNTSKYCHKQDQFSRKPPVNWEFVSIYWIENLSDLLADFARANTSHPNQFESKCVLMSEPRLSMTRGSLGSHCKPTFVRLFKSWRTRSWGGEGGGGTSVAV